VQREALYRRARRRRDVGGADLVAQQCALAEAAAGADARQLAAAVADHGLAGADHVEAVAGFALGDDDVAALERQRHQRLGHHRQLRRRQLGEQLHLAQQRALRRGGGSGA